MREITTHGDDAIQVVADNDGHGASNTYLFETEARSLGALRFQNGPIPDVGINGITNEVAIACVIDRLESFQAGPFKCAENEGALIALRCAMTALQSRTVNRKARGVEGKMQP